MRRHRPIFHFAGIINRHVRAAQCCESQKRPLRDGSQSHKWCQIAAQVYGMLHQLPPPLQSWRGPSCVRWAGKKKHVVPWSGAADLRAEDDNPEGTISISPYPRRGPHHSLLITQHTTEWLGRKNVLDRRPPNLDINVGPCTRRSGAPHPCGDPPSQAQKGCLAPVFHYATPPPARGSRLPEDKAATASRRLDGHRG